jgi:hypothetical protein
MTPLMHQWLSMVSMVVFMYVGFEVYKMTDDKLKQNYYLPFCDAWKVIKACQHVDETADSAEHWQNFTKEINIFAKKYPDSEYMRNLIQLLIDTADIIAKDNSAEGRI